MRTADSIRYLMRHRHTTPFEMCEIKLHVRVPMDTWRQWIRHRTANVNEYSTRYSVAIDAAAQTSPDAWRLQASGRKQGSEGLLATSVGANLSQREEALQEEARRVYEERLAQGVAREQARKDLPLSTYTEAYWKIDLHNLLHFLSLRMDSHAQTEIRAYANVLGNEIVSRWCPVTWKAFRDYQLESIILTAHEIQLVQCITASRIDDAMSLSEALGWLQRNDQGRLRTNREREEAGEKLTRLGLMIPWEAPENP